MKKKRKSYIPKPKYNVVVQAKKLDKLADTLTTHQRQINAISKSHDNHISHLANFARHDIKNTIQNMDSILSATSPNEFTEESVASLSRNLKVIRETMDNFAKLVPYSSSGNFKLEDLMIAVQLLARADMQKNDIEMTFQFLRVSAVDIKLPFQIVLQMINNLIINAIKSLETADKKKMFISASIDSDQLIIKIMDNGAPIESEDAEKIFDYGYSTTGGSGIGLYHARYLCKDFKGSVTVNLETEDGYNKTFIVSLPIILEKDAKEYNNN